VIGFDCTDDKQIALDFLKKEATKFLNILDTGEAAQNVFFDDYSGASVPLNYLIDREGKIVRGWSGGFDTKQELQILKDLGLE
jgi:hypothetical protein